MVAASRCLPGQSAGLASPAAPQRRPMIPVPLQRRTVAGARRRTAAGSTAGGPTAAASTSQQAAPSIQDLRAGLEEAIKAEDYASAARIRDRIAQMEAEDPVLAAEAALAEAVAEQRFEDAAKLRDRLKELRPPPPPPPPRPASPGIVPPPPVAGPYDNTATTTSETVTDGVRVTCRSFFVPSESAPAHNRFFFGYTISIRNESQHTVKLMERYWNITNGAGQTQEVRGPGVVGEQPELAPGESFQYQSACPLPTPRGTMEGHYEFYSKDPASGQWRKSFLVKIGQFGLRAD